MAQTCRGLATAVLCAIGAGAQAQPLERAVNQVQAGFERAFKIPLEIELLRAAVRKEAWQNDRAPSGLAVGPRAVARAERALHDDAVDPAAELEAHRAQRADAQKAVGGVQPY